MYNRLYDRIKDLKEKEIVPKEEKKEILKKIKRNKMIQKKRNETHLLKPVQLPKKM